jgi:hypothetical protein
VWEWREAWEWREVVWEWRMRRVTRGCEGVENGEWRVRIGEWGGLREGEREWRGGVWNDCDTRRDEL